MITILTPFGNRPDFIKPQYESLKKYLKDEFTYVVVNNAYYEQDKPKEIEEIANELNTSYVRIHHRGIKEDPCVLVRDTLNMLWKIFKDTSGILVIMDCDLFLTANISFEEIVKGYDMGFCPQYTHGKIWPWTGFMLFDMDKIKVEDVNFSFYALDEKLYSDVGSGLYAYILKNDPKIKCIDRKELLNGDWPLKGKTIHTWGFPFPYSADILSFKEKEFAFHYKTSGNYAKHCTPEYNEQKTKALCALLM